MNKKGFTLIELLVAIAIVVVLVGIIALTVGCDISTQLDTDANIAEQQEAVMKEAVAQTGLPAIQNFHEKKMLKMLYELRDQADLVCHAYLFNELNGEVGQYLGRCIGYGLPASTQYSNPQKLVDAEKQFGYSVYQDSGIVQSMPQAEPNGLFMPEGLSATWLMMINPESGEPEPVYIEPLIIVSPFRLDVSSGPVAEIDSL